MFNKKYCDEKKKFTACIHCTKLLEGRDRVPELNKNCNGMQK